MAIVLKSTRRPSAVLAQWPKDATMLPPADGALCAPERGTNCKSAPQPGLATRRKKHDYELSTNKGECDEQSNRDHLNISWIPRFIVHRCSGVPKSIGHMSRYRVLY